jgi:RNA polymerase sigma-70 factor (ECF subfamily)
MADTSASLLDRLRSDPNEGSWQRLVDLYTPLIRNWLRQQAALEQDADDLTQNVLVVVMRKVPEFERERTGSFRKWLRTITVNCLRDFRRGGKNRPVAMGDGAFAAVLEQLEDPHSSMSQLWDREHDQHVTRYLLDQIQDRFEPTTWQAFRRVALDGAPAADVAQELGLTVNAVFIAKSRVMTVLRHEGAGLLD